MNPVLKWPGSLWSLTNIWLKWPKKLQMIFKWLKLLSKMGVILIFALIPLHWITNQCPQSQQASHHPPARLHSLLSRSQVVSSNHKKNIKTISLFKKNFRGKECNWTTCRIVHLRNFFSLRIFFCMRNKDFHWKKKLKILQNFANIKWNNVHLKISD